LNYSSTKYFLTGVSPRTRSIHGDAGVTYIVGSSNNDPVYWDNTSGSFELRAPLDKGACSAGQLDDVFVAAGHIYAVGSTSPEAGCGATFWIDGTRYSLPDAEAGEVFYSDGELFLAGRCTDATATACYWRDSGADGVDLQEVRLSSGVRVLDMAVEDGTVYMVTGSGTYWVDTGTPTMRLLASPPDSGFNSRSTAIAVLDGTVYVAGAFDRVVSGTQYRYPCLWIDDGITASAVPLEPTSSTFTQAGTADVQAFYP